MERKRLGILATLGGAALLATDACGATPPTTPSPFRSPDATPSAASTLIATGTPLEVTPMPTPFATPTEIPTPTGTVLVTFPPTPTASLIESPNPTETASALLSPDTIINGDHTFVPATDVLTLFESLTPEEQNLLNQDAGAPYSDTLDALQNSCTNKSYGFRLLSCEIVTRNFYLTYVKSGDKKYFDLTNKLYNYTFNTKSGIFYRSDQQDAQNRDLEDIYNSNK